jgi:hypothetical protein
MSWLAKKLPDFLRRNILGTARTIGSRRIVAPWVRRVDNFGDAITVFSAGFIYGVTFWVVADLCNHSFLLKKALARHPIGMSLEL